MTAELIRKVRGLREAERGRDTRISGTGTTTSAMTGLSRARYAPIFLRDLVDVARQQRTKSGRAKIDVLENAGHALHLSRKGFSELDPAGSHHDDDLAWFHFAFVFRADDVERAGLRREESVAVERAERQRSDAKAVARADQLLVESRPQLKA